jgi:succinate dehydrogenase / fumarate reductase cytochrome b subunit
LLIIFSSPTFVKVKNLIMSKENFLESTIGRKMVMGLTGLFLISFLVVHVSINCCIFLNDGGVTFNKASHFMSHNPVIRVMEIGLFVGFLLHIYLSLKLTLKNNKARPVKYQVTDGKSNSAWYSRSMGILGSLLLLFLVVHLANFWVPTKKAILNGQEHDTYANMKQIFSVEYWYLILIYLLGVISLAYHLMHGFQSAFQSLGINHRKYSPIIKQAGMWFSIIVPLLFALMPISMAFGLIK